MYARLVSKISAAAAIILIAAAVSFASAADNRKVYIVPAEGVVDHGMAAFVGRGLRDAELGGASLIVIDIDTYGGQVDAAFSIVDSITACKVPTAAFVRSKAISAGALIAFAANKIAMRQNTTIGDVAPLTNTNDGPKMLGEKHQSPIRAKFRTLANRNGYPEILSEAMVTEEIAVFELTLPDTVMYLDSARAAGLDPQVKERVLSNKLVVRAGELLTMTDAEALRYGFSSMTVPDIGAMLREMGYADAEVITVGKSWSEKLVSVIAMLAPVLMMIGFSCLYIEMRSPGFGIPGIVGICCLAIVFFGQHIAGLAGYTEILLLVTGAVLLAVEILVLPGFGVAGISGIVLILIGMLLSFQNFVIPSPELPWQEDILKRNVTMVSVSMLGAIALIFIFFRYIFERLSMVVKGPYLAATLESARSDADMAFVPQVGDTGTASTPLRPSGKVFIGKNMCDVVTEGQYIDSGAEVTVSLIQGNRIVVAPK